MVKSKGRILCTEDDADTRELLILMLRMAGYEVICPNNAQDAVDLVRNENFDLCLLDNWTPRVSGEDLCKRIREFDPKTPILFYSGAGYAADKKRAHEAGAQGYLVKPVTNEVLVAEIVRIIAESRVGVPVGVVSPDHAEAVKPFQ